MTCQLSNKSVGIELYSQLSYNSYSMFVLLLLRLLLLSIRNIGDSRILPEEKLHNFLLSKSSPISGNVFDRPCLPALKVFVALNQIEYSSISSGSVAIFRRIMTLQTKIERVKRIRRWSTIPHLQTIFSLHISSQDYLDLWIFGRFAR